MRDIVFLIIVAAIGLTSCASQSEREAFYKSHQGKLWDNQAKNLINMRECDGTAYYVKDGVVHCGFGPDPELTWLKDKMPVLAREQSKNRPVCDVLLEEQERAERALGKPKPRIFLPLEQAIVDACNDQARIKAQLRNAIDAKR